MTAPTIATVETTGEPELPAIPQAPRRKTTDTLCGVCIGHRQIWCPGCSGFAGCLTCRFTYRVACPRCAGGKLEPILW